MKKISETLAIDLDEDGERISQEIDTLKTKAGEAIKESKDSGEIWLPLIFLFLIIALTVYYNLQNSDSND